MPSSVRIRCSLLRSSWGMARGQARAPIVTKNVPDDTLVVGMPARAIKKLQRKPKKDDSSNNS